jgi:hypothetical protein
LFLFILFVYKQLYMRVKFSKRESEKMSISKQLLVVFGPLPQLPPLPRGCQVPVDMLAEEKDVVAVNVICNISWMHANAYLIK